LNKLSVNRF